MALVPAGELVPVVPAPAPAEPVPGGTIPLVCPGELLLLGEEDVLLAGAVGLPPGETDGVAPALAEGLVVGLGLAQFVLAPRVVCFVLAFVLAVALVLALALALADTVDVAVPLALSVALALPPDAPEEGLTVELGDGVDVVDVVGVGLDAAGAGVGLAVGDDCGHDAIGDGRWCRAAVVEAPAPAPPPAAAWLLWPGVAGLAVSLELIPSKADTTDELSACRSGGTEAMTTPTANTAQAITTAGLIRPTRQSRCGPRRA